MTYQEAREIALNNTSETTVEVLQELVIKMNDDLNMDNDAFNLALECLEVKMDEVEYVEFLETL